MSSTATLEELEMALLDVEDQLRATQTLINTRKLEQIVPMSALEELRNDLVRRQVEVMVAINNFSARSKPKPSSTEKTSTVASGEPGNPPAAKGLNQRTLKGFVKVVKDGKICDLDGPRLVSDITHICTPCGKSLKSREGLIEHQNHCLVFKEQRLALSAVRTAKRVRAEVSSENSDGDSARVSEDDACGSSF